MACHQASHRSHKVTGDRGGVWQRKWLARRSTELATACRVLNDLTDKASGELSSERQRSVQCAELAEHAERARSARSARACQSAPASPRARCRATRGCRAAAMPRRGRGRGTELAELGTRHEHGRVTAPRGAQKRRTAYRAAGACGALTAGPIGLCSRTQPC